MIQTTKLRSLIVSETNIVELPDGKQIAVSTLPHNLQVAIATIDEWSLKQRELKIEIMQVDYAITAMRNDLVDKLVSMVQASAPITSMEAPPTE